MRVIADIRLNLNINKGVYIYKMETAWKIFIATTIVALVILAFTLSWPRISDKIWGRHPDTYVYAFGQEHSYTIDQLKAVAPIRSKISLVPIKVPEDASGSGTEVPLKFSNWTYQENEKLYTITVHNKGDGIDRNIKIDIDFTPNSIKQLKINNENRVSLIQGGKPAGTRAVLKIDELLPNEIQDVEILIEGKNVKSLTAWSEREQDIENIFIIDVIIEPDVTYR